MKMKQRILVAIVGLVLVISALVAIFIYETYRIDYSSINHIKGAQRGPNEFSDLANDICVTSADDINYIVKGRFHIQINYGRQVIDMNVTSFKSKEFHDRLKEIGIVVKYHENDDGSILYRVTYWDEVVEEIVYST